MGLKPAMLGKCIAPGKQHLMFGKWDAYIPYSYMPRILSVFSRRTMLGLIRRNEFQMAQYRKPVMCSEAVLTGLKFFEGNDVLTARADSQKFPVFNTTEGEVELKGQMVIMSCLAPSCDEYVVAMKEWADAYKGKVSVLHVSDMIESCALLNKATPELSHLKEYFSVTADCRHAYELLATNNRLVPYVFIVDEQGFIRWRSCWQPTEREKNVLAHDWSLD